MLQSIPWVAEVCRVIRASDLRLSEEQQLWFGSLEVVMDCDEIRVQSSNIGEVHFEWEAVQPLFD